MLRVLKKLPVAQPRVRASRCPEFRPGDAHVRGEHELFDDGALDTAVSHMTNQRCYVCRKPVPTSREKVEAGRWSEVRIGAIAIAALCVDCSPKAPTQSLDQLEPPPMAESA